ncbi:DUF4258 domain-containing protein [Nodularia spumigena]|jgi:hypothetical protein|uniref:DUF4258 domain-containing protein n=1 Tax=Nodularia spumigena UHCC 0060 TaxID=3110300 RepID=A0ABU5UUP4_NODSP|nr:DUF4258 domain-containing protein [Nodularia spumigena]MDB9324008.1 DUF4258 domain-containing protein [Nodularia spumigena CS-591/07A]MDB9332533.1 DUF4258 domain-containing protein [Nodularia spumigena CS-591/04]MDB9359746.1 DUF4258 domain-containing protein [Nodularia spumigena CS-588/02]MDB9365429.1 DUF4258 domain-containing protein [Nodularia spumigena CS-588/02A10]MEA5527460.1 DUF4258 domain-containing protein [Nodularia spumigena UHCC 0143]
MNTHKKLTQIFQSDENKCKLGTLTAKLNSKDHNHTARRKQQRAINETMIQIAILYGKKDFHHQDIRFTILDKNLRNTIYAKFVDELRGLRVICKGELPNPEIITVYWHNNTKQKCRR